MMTHILSDQFRSNRTKIVSLKMTMIFQHIYISHFIFNHFFLIQIREYFMIYNREELCVLNNKSETSRF